MVQTVERRITVCCLTVILIAKVNVKTLFHYVIIGHLTRHAIALVGTYIKISVAEVGVSKLAIGIIIDAIAIVAADTEEHARAAADAVKVEIEELPAYMNAMDAIAPDAAEIHPGTPNAFFETNCIKGPDFDWDSIPDSQQVEIESYCSRQPHLHLEPDCGYGYIDEENITIHIPAGFTLEACPRDTICQSPFGKLAFSLAHKGNDIKVNYKLLMNKGLFSADKYSQLYDFMKLLASLYSQKIVLKKI